ncbi:MAG: hypothetical protein Kilf2KO_01820 [Rhodospirillales bacterium]
MGERTLRPQEVIDLDRYPIEDMASPDAQALTTRLHDELERRQYVVLPDFIRPAARARAIEEIRAALPQAHHNAARRNCYLQRQGDPNFPADHPRNQLLDASTWMLAADLLPEASPLKTLYRWQQTRQLVAGIVGVPQLYANEDPFQPVNALCYRPGDRSAWHFDSENAFTMTLMLQAPEAGGRFEMAPGSRLDHDQCYDRVAKVLEGEAEVVEVGREEGALCIFRGCNALHRVSPVEGERLRVMGVFVYETEPGVTGDPEVNETVYGRRRAA